MPSGGSENNLQWLWLERSKCRSRSHSDGVAGSGRNLSTARYFTIFRQEALLKRCPAGRLGETEEAAHFTMSLLDGYNMFTTGNFFPITGGFNNT